MADLGANWKIVKDAFASRADWTAEQVRARWAYDQRRILASDGKLNEGIFFAALRAGQLAPARPDPERPIDVTAYAGQQGYMLGGATGPPSEAQQRQVAYHDAHWRAVEMLGPGAPFRDMRIVVEALVSGASDEAALAALDAHRSAVRR